MTAPGTDRGRTKEVQVADRLSPEPSRLSARGDGWKGGSPPAPRTSRTHMKSSPPRFLGFLLGSVVALLVAALPIGLRAAEGKIVVASKIDTEGALLGNMIVSLLEAQGLAVENKVQLGPTNIVRAAILAGQIDIYPEYTGNGALFFHIEQDTAWKEWARGGALVATLDR